MFNRRTLNLKLEVIANEVWVKLLIYYILKIVISLESTPIKKILKTSVAAAPKAKSGKKVKTIKMIKNYKCYLYSNTNHVIGAQKDPR